MDLRTELLSAFEALKKAMFSCDSNALEKLIALDYRGFDPQGQAQNKEMILEAYGPGGVQLHAYDVEELETRIIEPVGIIMGRGRIQGQYGEYRFEHFVRFVDVYVKKGGHWQLYYSQVTPLPAA